MTDARTREPRVGYLQEVSRRLSREYGDPRLNNKDDPLDELIFIILSAKTTESSYLRTYNALECAFPGWFGILSARPSRVRELIASGGLSTKKERQIRALLRKVDALRIRDLKEYLSESNDEAAEGFLETLPGVGTKSARCVLMYSLERRVFPIDTHVSRVLSRLGVYRSRRLTGPVQDRIQAMIPPEVRYPLHVNLVAHGRAVCTSANPGCRSCLLIDLCRFGSSHYSGGRSTHKSASTNVGKYR